MPEDTHSEGRLDLRKMVEIINKGKIEQKADLRKMVDQVNTAKEKHLNKFMQENKQKEIPQGFIDLIKKKPTKNSTKWRIRS